MQQYLENYRRWLDSPALTREERQELVDIANNDDEIKLRF
jgi:heme oxygenase